MDEVRGIEFTQREDLMHPTLRCQIQNQYGGCQKPLGGGGKSHAPNKYLPEYV